VAAIGAFVGTECRREQQDDDEQSGLVELFEVAGPGGIGEVAVVSLRQ
jgi:hypothetical protein